MEHKTDQTTSAALPEKQGFRLRLGGNPGTADLTAECRAHNYRLAAPPGPDAFFHHEHIRLHRHIHCGGPGHEHPPWIQRLISLGTAGFIGAGALGMGVFLRMGLPFELSALLVLLIAAGLGALIGLFSLKVESIYLAIATLFIGEILRQIYTSVPIFGGEFISIGAVKLFGFIELNQILQVHRSILYALIILVQFLGMLLMYNLVKSRTGRALMAMSRSEHAAQAMGINILKYRLIAFITATVYATSGGILYAMFFQNAPTRAWTLNISLLIIAMVVVGGFKSIIGTFLGAIIIYGIPNLFLKDLLGDISYVFSGVLIILVILFYPRGFVFVGEDIKRLFRRRRTAAADAGHKGGGK
jgi:branched-chain amino acid transport system permease protein